MNTYGIGEQQAVTALMVRDSIVQCFYEAHCADVGLDTADQDINRSYCRSIVEKAFLETGGQFDHPTKESLFAAMQWLATFSRNFRDPALIEQHIVEIQQLLDRLE